MPQDGHTGSTIAVPQNHYRHVAFSLKKSHLARRQREYVNCGTAPAIRPGCSFQASQ